MEKCCTFVDDTSNSSYQTDEPDTIECWSQGAHGIAFENHICSKSKSILDHFWLIFRAKMGAKTDKNDAQNWSGKQHWKQT